MKHWPKGSMKRDTSGSVVPNLNHFICKLLISESTLMCEKCLNAYQSSQMDRHVFDIWLPHWQSLKTILKVGLGGHEYRAFILERKVLVCVI